MTNLNGLEFAGLSPWLSAMICAAPFLLAAAVLAWDKVSDGERQRQQNRTSRAVRKTLDAKDPQSLREHAEWLARLERPISPPQRRWGEVLPWRRPTRSPAIHPGGQGDATPRETPATTVVPSSTAS